MQFLLIFAVVLAAAVVLWRVWRRYMRQLVAGQSPDSFILPQDENWSLDVAGTARDRWIPVTGTINLRDIGGYPAADGHRVKWDEVYRSGTLADITPEDVETLKALNIKMVCDFRSAAEMESAPDRADRFEAAYEPMPMNADQRSFQRLGVLLFRPTEIREMMRQTYNQIVIVDSAPYIGRFLRLVSDSANRPILFHCTAGKDRTGMAAMILLSLLGVADDVIAADYSLSNRFYSYFHEHASGAVGKIAWLGITADDLRPMLIADPELMHGALAHVRRLYGSVEAYVTGPCGVDASTVISLRAQLLEG